MAATLKTRVQAHIKTVAARPAVSPEKAAQRRKNLEDSQEAIKQHDAKLMAQVQGTFSSSQ